MYSVHQKHLTIFEILKAGWLLLGTSLLTVTMNKDALSLVEMERWSVHHHHHTAAVESFFIIKTVCYSCTAWLLIAVLMT